MKNTIWNLSFIHLFAKSKIILFMTLKIIGIIFIKQRLHLNEKNRNLAS